MIKNGKTFAIPFERKVGLSLMQNPDRVNKEQPWLIDSLDTVSTGPKPLGRVSRTQETPPRWRSQLAAVLQPEAVEAERSLHKAPATPFARA